MWIISLIWPKRGFDAEQGMVLGVRGLKRVEEQARKFYTRASAWYQHFSLEKSNYIILNSKIYLILYTK